MNVKDGPKTTEFWMAFLAAGIMVAYSFNVINENQKEALNSLVGALAVIIVYIIQRGMVKAAASKAQNKEG